MLRLTSIRKGFVGGGFGGRRSLPKKMAMKARIPGAELIPDDAQLFLGFTSTQQGALGPGRIANFETLPGFTDQWPHGSFRGGTAMHLSHVYEDVELWYTQYNEIRRMWQAMDAGRAEFVAGPATLPSGPDSVQSFSDLQAFAIRDADGNDGIAGHSATMQPVNRLATAAARQSRNGASPGHGRAPALRLQHARQPVLLVGVTEARSLPHDAESRVALRRLLADERLLPSPAARDGRPVCRRHRPAAQPSFGRAGDEFRPPHDPSPELPRPAAGTSCFPACGAGLICAALCLGLAAFADRPHRRPAARVGGHDLAVVAPANGRCRMPA